MEIVDGWMDGWMDGWIREFYITFAEWPHNTANQRSGEVNVAETDVQHEP